MNVHAPGAMVKAMPFTAVMMLYSLVSSRANTMSIAVLGCNGLLPLKMHHEKADSTATFYKEGPGRFPRACDGEWSSIVKQVRAVRPYVLRLPEPGLDALSL